MESQLNASHWNLEFAHSTNLLAGFPRSATRGGQSSLLRTILNTILSRIVCQNRRGSGVLKRRFCRIGAESRQVSKRLGSRFDTILLHDSRSLLLSTPSVYNCLYLALLILLTSDDDWHIGHTSQCILIIVAAPSLVYAHVILSMKCDSDEKRVSTYAGTPTADNVLVL